MGSASLRRIIPKTVRYKRSELEKMLNRFGMVYVKPDVGTHGIGVMRVERSRMRYRLQYDRRLRSFASFSAMAVALERGMRGRRYLIQRGIRLLKHEGRVFDLRVMVQLNLSRRWQTTGLIGRVAAPRKIVTNYHSGGRLLSVGRLLSGRMGKAAVPSQIRKLEKLGERAGRAMHKRFAGVREVGVDVGLDRRLTPWIIEVNTRPDPYIFRKLSNPAVFRTIRRYARAYGRL
jgi:hypothetical protein